MSVARRASVAAGIAAVRRDRQRHLRQTTPQLQSPEVNTDASNTITVVAGTAPNYSNSPQITPQLPKPAMALERSATAFAAVAKAAVVSIIFCL